MARYEKLQYHVGFLDVIKPNIFEGFHRSKLHNAIIEQSCGVDIYDVATVAFNLAMICTWFFLIKHCLLTCKSSLGIRFPSD